MKNKKMIAMVLGIMCLLLTAGIFIQIRTVKSNNSTVSNNYEENNLRAEVLKYKERYDNKYKELEKAENELEKERENSTKNDGDLKQKEEEITNGNKIIGLSEVTGSGVIVTLTDSKKDISSSLNPSELVVHDLDVLSVINELKNAGAEAISINDQRIVSNTVIECIGAVIKINGQRVGAPFTIKAIGMPELLKNTYRNGGYLKVLEGDRIQVDFKTSDNITIPKYTGTYKFEYAQTINNK